MIGPVGQTILRPLMLLAISPIAIQWHGDHKALAVVNLSLSLSLSLSLWHGASGNEMQSELRGNGNPLICH